MKISKKKTLVFSFLGTAAVLACAIGAGNTSKLLSSRAAMSHTADCEWNHYFEVAASVTTPGCKEFWACCSHPGEHVMKAEDVTGTNITDKGALASNLIAEFADDDDRLIKPLLPGYEVVFDTRVADWIGIASSDAGTPSHGYTDEVYGPYAKSEHFSRTNDQIAISPDVKNNPQFNGDIRVYETLTFWVMADQDIAGIGIKKDRYTNVKNYNLTANTWTKIEFNTDDIESAHLYNTEETSMGFGKWGSVTDVSFKFTSIYGKLKANTVIYDAATKGFTDEVYPTGGTHSVNNVDAATGRVYSEIANMSHNEWMWVRPDSTEIITDYELVYFYVRISAIPGQNRGVVYDYAVKQSVQLIANEWVRVVVDPAALGFDTLDDIGFGGWGPYDTLTLQFSSIYALAKPNHCVDIKIHGCSEQVAVATKTSYTKVSSVKFDAKLNASSTTWCGLAMTSGATDFYATGAPAVINPAVNVWQTWEYLLIDDGSGYFQVQVNGQKVTEGNCDAFKDAWTGRLFFVCGADAQVNSFSIDNVVITYDGGTVATEDFEGESISCLFTVGTGASIISKL